MRRKSRENLFTKQKRTHCFDVFFWGVYFVIWLQWDTKNMHKTSPFMKNSTRRKGTHRSRVVRLFSFLFHLEFEDQSGQSSSSHFIFWGLLEETKKKRSRLLLSFSVQWSFSWLCCSSSLLLPPTTIHDSASGLIDALRQNWREIKVLFRVWNEEENIAKQQEQFEWKPLKHYYLMMLRHF